MTKEEIKSIVRETILEMQNEKSNGDYVDCRQAAKILNISVSRLRHLKHKFPHVKVGNSEQGKLLFLKKHLVENYVD